MNSLIEKIEVSLLRDDTDENRKKWAEYIVSNKIPLIDIIELLHAEKRAATRFIWVVGDLCELDPKVVYPAITYFWSKKNETEITNYNRSLAKMFWLCGIPEKIEGVATNEMFEWLLDPEVIVSTKNYSLLALANLTDKYSELKSELRMIIEDQLEKNSIAFAKCAQKVLKKING